MILPLIILYVVTLVYLAITERFRNFASLIGLQGWLLFAVALVAIVTAGAGPIAFVALSAPQVARRLAGSAGIPLFASAAVGALLLLCADLIAQHALPVDVPVGIVTVVLGGIYLLTLLVNEARSRR